MPTMRMVRLTDEQIETAYRQLADIEWELSRPRQDAAPAAEIVRLYARQAALLESLRKLGCQDDQEIQNGIARNRKK
jgi:hypothetical protein